MKKNNVIDESKKEFIQFSHSMVGGCGQNSGLL